MKIALASDVHLEFGDLNITNATGCDTLILSGDICVAQDLVKADPTGIIGNAKSERFISFFERCANAYKDVIYIMGNHEHYHGDFKTSIEKLREFLGHIKNLHILDKECVTIDDITFIGGTLWTDMNKEDEMTLYHINSMMNDFRIVKNSNKLTNFSSTVFGTKEDGSVDYSNMIGNKVRTRPAEFSPADAVEDHKLMLEFIKATVDANPTRKFVVVGHHSPAKASTKPRYQDDVLMNGAYSSDLTDFILDRPQIKLWTHGHTHHAFDYMVGSTRIVCNPRGYFGYEDPNETGYNQDIVLEV
jgi:Icc-related predicted phosphoesterase